MGKAKELEKKLYEYEETYHEYRQENPMKHSDNDNWLLGSESFVCDNCDKLFDTIYNFNNEDVTCPHCNTTFGTSNSYISTETGWIACLRPKGG